MSSAVNLESEKPAKVSSFELGLALFCMYFGAGNLIFPMVVGGTAGSNNLFAILGFCLTAVFFPLLGLYAMMLYNGETKSFFARLGDRFGFWLFFVIQLIVGPFYVIPRLFTIMWGSFSSVFPNCPKSLFLGITMVGIYYATRRNSRMIQLLGYTLTPVLVISLAAIIGVGLYHHPQPVAATVSTSKSFFGGFFTGYNTMDLIASFLFASAIMPAIKKGTVGMNKKESQSFIGRQMMKSGLVMAALLVASYAGLGLVASYYAPLLTTSVPQEQWLSAIATHLIGPFGSIIASTAVLLACFTTALTLVSTFSNFMKKEVFKEKVKEPQIAIVTLFVAALVGSMNFTMLVAIFGPVLQVIYPGLIAMSFLNIAYKLKGIDFVKLPVMGIMAYGLVKFALAFIS